MIFTTIEIYRCGCEWPFNFILHPQSVQFVVWTITVIKNQILKCNDDLYEQKKTVAKSNTDIIRYGSKTRKKVAI